MIRFSIEDDEEHKNAEKYNLKYKKKARVTGDKDNIKVKIDTEIDTEQRECGNSKTSGQTKKS